MNLETVQSDASKGKKMLLRALFVVLLTATVSVSCGRETRELALVSTSPDKLRRVEVSLRRWGDFSSGTLMIEGIDATRRVQFGPVQIERIAGVEGASGERFESPICFSEISWATSDKAAVLVKNCLGHVTIVGIDCEKWELLSGSAFHATLRKSIYSRYQNEIGITESDALEWVRRDGANRAYERKSIGNGRLMD